MKKLTLVSCVVAGLLGTMNVAVAEGDEAPARLLQLSEQQMDTVSAGQTSVAGGWASVLYGRASSISTSSTFSTGTVNHTSASSQNLAIGIGADANAWGWSTF